MILAGGEGKRLYPLTRDRAKPAVPFGGRYRIIDFVLSNLVNSGISAIYILTQYKGQSVLEHVQRAWLGRVAGRDSFIQVVPAQMQRGEEWYQGTAYTNNYYYTLLRRDAYKESVISGNSSLLQPGTTTNTYDANSHLVAVNDSGNSANNRSFVNDDAGRVLYTRHDQLWLLASLDYPKTHDADHDPAQGYARTELFEVVVSD